MNSDVFWRNNRPEIRLLQRRSPHITFSVRMNGKALLRPCVITIDSRIRRSHGTPGSCADSFYTEARWQPARELFMPVF